MLCTFVMCLCVLDANETKSIIHAVIIIYYYDCYTLLWLFIIMNDNFITIPVANGVWIMVCGLALSVLAMVQLWTMACKPI